MIERLGVVRFEFYRVSSVAQGSGMVRETAHYFAVTRQSAPNEGWQIDGRKGSGISEVTYGEVPIGFAQLTPKNDLAPPLEPYVTYRAYVICSFTTGTTTFQYLGR